MDNIDLLILRILQKDGRITNTDLAKKVGLSAPSVLDRVRKLEDSGIITGYEAKINPEKVGRGQTCFVAVSLALHQLDNIEEFHRQIDDIPEVMEYFHITGEEDYLLRVAVRDIKHYEELLLNRLTKIPGTSKIKTMVVLSSMKSGSKIILDEDDVHSYEGNKIRDRSQKRNSKNKVINQSKH